MENIPFINLTEKHKCRDHNSIKNTCIVDFICQNENSLLNMYKTFEIQGFSIFFKAKIVKFKAFPGFKFFSNTDCSHLCV